MSLLNRKTTLKASTSVASAAQTFLPSLSDRNHHSDYEGQGDPQKLQDALIASGHLGDKENLSPYAVVLAPLLIALNWRGQFRQLCEALPQREGLFDECIFRNAMARLGFLSDRVRVPLSRLDERLFPCMYKTDDGKIYVILARDAHSVTLFDAQTDHADVVSFDEITSGEALVFYNRDDPYIPDSIQARLPKAQDKAQWSSFVMRRFSKLIKQAVAMSAVINLLGLAGPFLIMGIIGIVMSTHNMNTLIWFCAGGALAVLAEVVLRQQRGAIMGIIAARFDHIISNSIFEKVLNLPMRYTEHSTVSAQMARLRDYMSIGPFIQGGLMSALMDVPFIIFMIAAMAIFSVKMAMMTCLSVTIFAAVTFATKGVIRRAVQDGAEANVRKQEMIMEALMSRDMILQTRAVPAWLHQYKLCCGTASTATMKSTLLSSMLETSGYALTMLAGVAIVSVGVLDVWAGHLQIGALVGAVILLWRTINPIQSVLTNIPRIEQVLSSLKQIDRLMALEGENDEHVKTQAISKLKGDIEIERVSLRHTPDSEPALLGVNLKIKEGATVAITGHNGSGKSTLLKTMMGIYYAQAGSVQIDNTDIRQMNPSELRHAIGYMPQNASLMSGTIASNLRLADPTATVDDMRDVMMLVQGWDAIQALPDGLQTKIKDAQTHDIPHSLAQKISLARAFIGHPGILLIDEAEGVFTEDEKRVFLDILGYMAHRPTIIFATQDQDIIEACDHVYIMHRGELHDASQAPVVENEPKIIKGG